MGFLLGAYGKLAAGSRYRQLQSKMMGVQSRLRRVTKDVANMEKSINAQKTQELNNLKMGKMAFGQLLPGFVGNNIQGMTPETLQAINGGLSIAGLTPQQLAEMKVNSGAITAYNQMLGQMNSQYESLITMAQQSIEQKYDDYKEMMLEPLKQEEEDLQIEKDTLESQVQIAKEDYEACKKMEQDGAKTFAPQYTA